MLYIAKLLTYHLFKISSQSEVIKKDASPHTHYRLIPSPQGAGMKMNLRPLKSLNFLFITTYPCYKWATGSHVVLVQDFFPPDLLPALIHQMRIIFPAEKSSTFRHTPCWCSPQIFNHIPLFINMWGIWFWESTFPLEGCFTRLKIRYLFSLNTTSFFGADIKHSS